MAWGAGPAAAATIRAKDAHERGFGWGNHPSERKGAARPPKSAAFGYPEHPWRGKLSSAFRSSPVLSLRASSSEARRPGQNPCWRRSGLRCASASRIGFMDRSAKRSDLLIGGSHKATFSSLSGASPRAGLSERTCGLALFSPTTAQSLPPWWARAVAPLARRPEQSLILQSSPAIAPPGV